MARLRYNGLTATLGAPLASGDTTITFTAALTSAAGAVPTIAGADTIALSILNASGAVSEIVSLTAYTSGATTGTITRAQESTTAAAHASGDIVVHSATAADFASGTGTAAQSYVGTSTPGGTMTALVSKRVYMKKVTLATSGLLTSVEAYIDGAGASSQVDSLNVAVMADSAGSPAAVVAASMLRDTSTLLNSTSGTATSDPRWFALPVGKWLTAGSYWFAVSMFTDASPGLRIANTTGGSDRYYDSAGSWFSDGSFYTVTTTTTNYSIRGNLITL